MEKDSNNYEMHHVLSSGVVHYTNYEMHHVLSSGVVHYTTMVYACYCIVIQLEKQLYKQYYGKVFC